MAENLLKETGNAHLKEVLNWFEGRAVSCVAPGGSQVTYMSVSSMLPFANHACNKSKVTLETTPAFRFELGNETVTKTYFKTWSGAAHRYKRMYCTVSQMSRDVKAGTEITKDYLAFDDRFTKRGRDNFAAGVKSWCK